MRSGINKQIRCSFTRWHTCLLQRAASCLTSWDSSRSRWAVLRKCPVPYRAQNNKNDPLPRKKSGAFFYYCHYYFFSSPRTMTAIRQTCQWSNELVSHHGATTSIALKKINERTLVNSVPKARPQTLLWKILPDQCLNELVALIFCNWHTGAANGQGCALPWLMKCSTN